MPCNIDWDEMKLASLISNGNECLASKMVVDFIRSVQDKGKIDQMLSSSSFLYLLGGPYSDEIVDSITENLGNILNSKNALLIYRFTDKLNNMLALSEWVSRYPMIYQPDHIYLSSSLSHLSPKVSSSQTYQKSSQYGLEYIY
ncbi:MAG: hypothetical protein NZM04_00690 [Methylacidiphilales bacterium]|nr:hypothetical protein [Candidatus Methylacidiphilales bacterium]